MTREFFDSRVFVVHKKATKTQLDLGKNVTYSVKKSKKKRFISNLVGKGLNDL